MPVVHAGGLVAALSFAVVLPATAFAQATASVDPAAVAHAVLAQTNAFRAANGVRRVERNPALASAAQAFAAYMARTDRYGHEADGRAPEERATEHGYAYCLVAENIAYYVKSSGFRSAELAQALVEGWQQSPPHRRNMLDADVVDSAAAVAQSPSSGRWYGVQLFGLPASAGIRFEITNRADAPVDYRLGERRYQLPPRVRRTHEGCRVPDLVVHGPGAGAVVKPANGDRFALSRTHEGRWQLERL